MRGVLTFLFALLLTSCSVFEMLDTPPSEPTVKVVEAPPREPVHQRKRIMVVKFANRSKQADDDLVQFATNYVREDLARRPEFTMVPIEQLESTEDFFNEFGDFNEREILTAARLRNVSAIVLGTITDIKVKENAEEVGFFRTRYVTQGISVKLQLLDTATERDIVAKEASAEITDEHTDFFQNTEKVKYDPERSKMVFTRAIEKIVGTLPEFARKIAWLGRIAKIDLHRYYINAGEMSGIARGQLLRVFDEGHPIEDPDTHSSIGISPGRLKGMLKVIDFFGEDGAVAILHSGGGFRERDRVEQYSNAEK